MDPVVQEARGWIGTPYVHQASVKGAGCDCLGLIRGIWRTLHGTEPVNVPRYTADWDEPQGTEVLMRAAQTYMAPAVDDWQPGQVLLFRMRQGAVAKHLGILGRAGDQPSFIHAYTGHGVVESPLSAPWRRRVVARFAYLRG